MSFLAWTFGVGAAAGAAWLALRSRPSRAAGPRRGRQTGALRSADVTSSLPRRSSGRRRGISGPHVEISALRTDRQQAWMDQELVRDAELLKLALVDVRDACGAEEAVLWSWDEERMVLAAKSWASPGAEAPAGFRSEQWTQLLLWTAEEKRLQVIGGDGTEPMTLAAAPVENEGGGLFGVLSVSRAEGLLSGVEYVRSWVPRHASHVRRVVEGSNARVEAARQARHARALLEAIKRIQPAATPDALGQAICETAVEATSAAAAALVRWNSIEGTASIQYATGGFRLPPTAVAADSLVTMACTKPMVVPPEMGRRLASTNSLFGGDRWEGDGECAVIPILRGDSCLGAIAVWASSEGMLSLDELDNLRTLGAAATTSLESVWQMEEVEQRARTDPLTGLGNRRFLDERLEMALAETDRFGAPSALIMVDLDHFKKVNDTWGHDAGDHVLRRVAKVLSEGVRAVDTCVRYGGEEMALLLPHTSLEGAVELADRLRRVIEARPVLFQGVEIPVTASFGVSAYPDAARTRESLVAQADKALYDAKRAGRNCVRAAPMRQGSAA